MKTGISELDTKQDPHAAPLGKRVRRESGIAATVLRGSHADIGVQTGPAQRRLTSSRSGNVNEDNDEGAATLPAHNCQVRALRSIDDLCAVCISSVESLIKVFFVRMCYFVPYVSLVILKSNNQNDSTVSAMTHSISQSYADIKLVSDE